MVVFSLPVGYRPHNLVPGIYLTLSVIMVTIAVGVQDRPPTAPKTDGAWISDYKLVGNPSFTEAISGVSSIVFAYCGTPGQPAFSLRPIRVPHVFSY